MQARDGDGQPAGELDAAAWFERSAPLVLEIGCGAGVSTFAMACSEPHLDVIAVEVYRRGLGQLLSAVDREGLTNVRLIRGDGVDVLEHLLVPASLTGVRVFFPDPWPKARHHKRRLIQPAHVSLLGGRLVPGGTLHCATDWADYAEAMLEALTGDPLLANAYDGYAPRPAGRPLTKFEQRGIEAGRPAFDLIFRRDQP
jgi:tRNA (guanine-N7-)-methyltransferase